MEKKKYFKETVHMPSRKLLATALIAIPLIVAFAAFNKVYVTESLGLSLATMGTILCLTGLVSYLIYSLELKTKVTSRGVEVRMRPFFPKKRIIGWDEMESCTMVTAPRMAIRQGEDMAFIMERRFTLNGLNGVSIVTKDGEQIFIGSLRPEKLKKAIETAWRD